MEASEEEISVPMSDQRTVYLVNIFVVHTTRFLNRFSALCEQKLADVHRRILRLDATLTLLEAKLKSVDGVEEASEPSSQHAQPVFASNDSVPELARDSGVPSSETTQLPSGTSEISEQQKASTVSPPTPEQHLQTLRDDPKYSRFFRMLRVGVPEQAVKMQMSIEGLDPALLNQPDAVQSPG